MRRLWTLYCTAMWFALCACLPARADAAGTLVWYGQSTFKMTTPSGRVILFDPWFTNPVNPAGQAAADALDKVDLILVSHGHFDHVGQAAQIATRTGARLVATLDLGEALKRYGGFPAQNMSYETLGNVGGTLTFFDGEVRITIVPAVHSSHVNAKDLGIGADDEAHWGGSASGFVVQVRGGPTVYHTGDTDVFADMATIGRERHIDLMLACIGDHFTMGPSKAAEAVKLVKPGHVVPMHFGTFVPLMTGTPEAFRAELRKRHLEKRLMNMKVGVTIGL